MVLLHESLRVDVVLRVVPEPRQLFWLQKVAFRVLASFWEFAVEAFADLVQLCALAGHVLLDALHDLKTVLGKRNALRNLTAERRIFHRRPCWAHFLVLTG